MLYIEYTVILPARSPTISLTQTKRTRTPFSSYVPHVVAFNMTAHDESAMGAKSATSDKEQEWGRLKLVA